MGVEKGPRLGRLSDESAGCPGETGVEEGEGNCSLYSRRWRGGALGGGMGLAGWKREVAGPGDNWSIEEASMAPGLWLLCYIARGAAQITGAQEEQGL